MRTLHRNKTAFYYATFSKRTPRLDEYGNDSGESDIEYSEPVKAAGNISAAQGQADTLVFGTDIAYDKVIVMEECPFDENAVLWVDRSPDNDAPHDYIVKKIAKSLNSCSIAVSRVNVT